MSPLRTAFAGLRRTGKEPFLAVHFLFSPDPAEKVSGNFLRPVSRKAYLTIFGNRKCIVGRALRLPKATETEAVALQGNIVEQAYACTGEAKATGRAERLRHQAPDHLQKIQKISRHATGGVTAVCKLLRRVMSDGSAFYGVKEIATTSPASSVT